MTTLVSTGWRKGHASSSDETASVRRESASRVVALALDAASIAGVALRAATSEASSSRQPAAATPGMASAAYTAVPAAPAAAPPGGGKARPG